MDGKGEGGRKGVCIGFVVAAAASTGGAGTGGVGGQE